MPDALRWVFRAHSEIGLVRKMNQDSGFVGRHLVLIADGMGGAAAGDLASAVAVDVIKHVDERVEPAMVPADRGESAPELDDAEARHERNRELLSTAIAEANARISDLVVADYELEGMGTTVTGGVLDADQLSLAHLGDSRAYLFRDGRLERLTHDHSWVQSLIDDGKISADEAAVHPHRSLLLKVLNGQPANEPDLTRVPLRAGDRLLFCSDGLCGFVEDEDIATELAGPDLDAVMDALVADAHAAGGADNITIILVDLVDAAESPADGPSEDLRDGPAVVPVVLGAATERQIPANDTMVRSRLRPVGADDPDTDDDPVDGDHDDGDHDGTDDEDRYAPQLPARRRVLRPLVGLLVLVLVLGAGFGAGFAWSRTQYYVGASGTQVAIFQGLAAKPLGLPLSRVYEIQQLPVSALPPVYQEMVQSGIEVADLDRARATVGQLREAADVCAHRPGGSAGSTPSASATGTATATSTAKSSPRATAKSTPTGTPRNTPKASAKPTASTSTAAATTGTATPTPGATVSGALPPGSERC